MNKHQNLAPLGFLWAHWIHEAFCLLTLASIAPLVKAVSRGTGVVDLKNWTTYLGTAPQGIRLYSWGLILSLLLLYRLPAINQEEKNFMKTYGLFVFLPVLFLYSFVNFLTQAFMYPQGGLGLTIPRSLSCYLWVPSLVALYFAHKFLETQWAKPEDQRRPLIY